MITITEEINIDWKNRLNYYLRSVFVKSDLFIATLISCINAHGSHGENSTVFPLRFLSTPRRHLSIIFVVLRQPTISGAGRPLSIHSKVKTIENSLAKRKKKKRYNFQLTILFRFSCIVATTFFQMTCLIVYKLLLVVFYHIDWPIHCMSHNMYLIEKINNSFSISLCMKSVNIYTCLVCLPTVYNFTGNTCETLIWTFSLFHLKFTDPKPRVNFPHIGQKCL
jgi:hypothetical protein